MVLQGFLSWLIPRHKSCWRIALTLRRAFSSPLTFHPTCFSHHFEIKTWFSQGQQKTRSASSGLECSSFPFLIFLCCCAILSPLSSRVCFHRLWQLSPALRGANGPKNRHRKEGRGCYFNFLWQCQQRAEHKSGGGCRSFGIARFPDLSVTQVLFNGFSKLLWRTGQTISGMSLKQFNLSPLFVTPCDMQFRRPAWRQANDMMCRSVGGQLIQRPSMPAVSHARLLFNK